MTSWMREEPKGPDSEEYLLGLSVDKNFEQQGTMGQINAVEYDCTPESIFSSRAEHQVDLQRKLQEDPLVLIKKQELDTRRQVLDNPIKMKHLKEYIEKTKKSKKKKKEKKKKRKKHRGSDDSDDSDSEEDLNRLLLQKLEQFDPTAATQKDSPEKKHSRRSSSGSPKRNKRPKSTDGQKRSSEDSRRRSPDRGERRGRSRSPPRRRRRRSPSGSKEGSSSKEEKLREMMENAKWREEQRTKNVKHYREMEEREEKKKTLETHDPEFIRRQLEKAAASGSLEKRIQSNRYNIQRGASAMDQHFAKK